MVLFKSQNLNHQMKSYYKGDIDMIRRGFLTKLLKGSAAHLLFSAILLACSGGAVAADAAFISNHFSGSQNCAFCHDGLIDSNGTDVSIAKDWGTSMMANATKDPFWRAKVATELERNPALADIINDKCSTCHAPMANYEMKLDGAPITILGEGSITDPSNPYHDAAMEGISCTLCHQIKDDAVLGTLDGFSGNYPLNGNKEIYGQFMDIFPNPMINNSGYTPVYSAHISDSAVCATCHNLKTPFVDADGNLASSTLESEFPEQMVYTEWENSVFARGSEKQSCQDCHMPHTDGVKLSTRPRWLGARDAFATHTLAGANTVMLNLLANNATQLDVDASGIDAGIQRGREMLRGSGGIEILSSSLSNGKLTVDLKVRNDSGHKLPTSYPSRRVFIHFKVTGDAGQTLFESGLMNPDGSIVGVNSDSDPAAYEPHYELITEEHQVQLYEPIMGNTDGEVTYTLLRSARYLKDNRLLPRGFDKSDADALLDVSVNGAARQDDDFIAGEDRITYQVAVGGGNYYNVTAELIYQPLAHGFVADLYNNLDVKEVAQFKVMYDRESLKSELIASAAIQIQGNQPASLPAPTVQLLASPATINSGESVTLSWSSSDATACIASGDWNGAKATDGSELVDPLYANATFELSCSGDGGTALSSTDVSVIQTKGKKYRNGRK